MENRGLCTAVVGVRHDGAELRGPPTLLEFSGRIGRLLMAGDFAARPMNSRTNRW